MGNLGYRPDCCKNILVREDWHCDHKVPRSKGGTTSVDNAPPAVRRDAGADLGRAGRLKRLARSGRNGELLRGHVGELSTHGPGPWFFSIEGFEVGNGFHGYVQGKANMALLATDSNHRYQPIL